MKTAPRAVFTSMVRTICGRQLVVVIDHANEAHSISVTNDAEAVVAYCVEKFGHLAHTIVYRDTDGDWDELQHVAGVFTAFGRLSPEVVAELNLIP